MSKTRTSSLVNAVFQRTNSRRLSPIFRSGFWSILLSKLVVLGLIGCVSFPVNANPNDAFAPNVSGQNLRKIIEQPDGKILIAGFFQSVSGVAGDDVVRLHSNGSVDTSFSKAVATAEVASLALQPDGRIIIVGRELQGALGPVAQRLNSNGSLDTSFNVNIVGDNIFDVLVQPDGKIVLAGQFSSVNGEPHHNIVRLNGDGSTDSGFSDPQIGVGSSATSSLAVVKLQKDGRLLIGGQFSRVSETTTYGFARLNSNGALDTSFLNSQHLGTVRAIEIQPDGGVLIGGRFTHFFGEARKNLARITNDGVLDGDFNPVVEGPGARVRSILTDSEGKIFIGGTFTNVNGQVHDRIARLHPNGEVDQAFNTHADGTVLSMLQQSGGKLIIVGIFQLVSDADSSKPRNYIARLNSDGSLEVEFNASIDSGGVTAMAVQGDGKAIIGGTFTSINGIGRIRLARFNQNGNLDASFSPVFNDAVRAVAVQTDGKILVGGDFTHINGNAKSYLARLNPDGSPDNSFVATVGAYVDSISVQQDGGILITGLFGSVNGFTRPKVALLGKDGVLNTNFMPMPFQGIELIGAVAQPDGKVVLALSRPEQYLVRLNANGSIDSSFATNNEITSPEITSLALQADGKILIGGDFGVSSSTTRNIARFNSDGSIDTGFNVQTNQIVYSLATDAGGHTTIAGGFTTVNGEVRSSIAQLDSGGNLTDEYVEGANKAIRAVATQHDGKLLVAGNFSEIGSVNRMRIARLSGKRAVIQSAVIQPNGRNASWTLKGAAPNFHRTTIQTASVRNAEVEWSTPIKGIYSNGVWRFNTLNIAPNSNYFLRFTGYFKSGFGNGSESHFETIKRVNLSGTSSQDDELCVSIKTNNGKVAVICL